jgi:hypothetical protein
MSVKIVRSTWILVFGLAVLGSVAAGQEAPALDAAKKQAIVDEVATLLNREYIFADTAKKMEEALRAQLENGSLDKAADASAFARAVSMVLSLVSKDGHIGFAYNPALAEDMRRLQGQSEEDRRKVRERRELEARRNNFGFRKVERLDGNVGYLDFRMFASPDQAGPTAIAAMSFLAHCDAIIVDLRQNGGGDPAQIQLISTYFFDEPVHLNDLYARAADRTENYWTLPFVPGPRASGADLYILTSARTFSGAEEFTYNMKNLKRGTVIGETTGGGAHPTATRIVQRDYVLRVPFARAINPYSQTNWEGTGVTPDIACPAAEAFDKAYALAVEKLAAKATDADRKAEYAWILAGLKARSETARVDASTLKSFVGVYGERTVTFENGSLFYQRTGPKYRLLPMSGTLFAVEGLEYFRVEFTVRDGRAVEVVGLYDDGRREPSPRTK